MKKAYSTTRDVVTEFVPRYAKGASLDIGAGVAKYRSLLERYVTSYKTSDIEAKPGVDFVEDARKMSLESSSFDTVFSFQVLEHVDDPEAVIGEMYRVLRSDGIAIVTAPFLVSEHADPSDYQRFTTHGLRVRFEKAGFEVLECGPYGGLFTVFAEMVKFAYLNPYRVHRNHFVRFCARRFVYTLLWIDRRRQYTGDVYANVYLVAQK